MSVTKPASYPRFVSSSMVSVLEDIKSLFQEGLFVGLL
jgi:hypothetical protein